MGLYEAAIAAFRSGARGAFEDGDSDRARQLVAATRPGLSEAGQIPDPDDAAEEERLEAELSSMGTN